MADRDDWLREAAEILALTCRPELGGWFRDGVEAYLAGSAGLEQALGLSRVGRNGSRSGRLKLEQRNALLRQALDLIPGSEWARYGELAKWIRALDRIRNPGEFEKLLLEAREYGELPNTPEGIWRALRGPDPH